MRLISQRTSVGGSLKEFRLLRATTVEDSLPSKSFRGNTAADALSPDTSVLWMTNTHSVITGLPLHLIKKKKKECILDYMDSWAANRDRRSSYAVSSFSAFNLKVNLCASFIATCSQITSQGNAYSCGVLSTFCLWMKTRWWRGL